MAQMERRLTVAIIGRPNVGKSTLFNRLVGKKLAIVDDTPGVTRDWRAADARVGGLEFTVVDTAGLEEAFDGSLEARMRRQTERAIERADVCLFLIDARAGVTTMDHHFGAWLRKVRTPVVLVANKCEGKASQSGLFEAFELGLGEPIPISAEHGEGMADLVQALLPYAREVEPDSDGTPAEPGAEAVSSARAVPAKAAGMSPIPAEAGIGTTPDEDDDDDATDADGELIVPAGVPELPPEEAEPKALQLAIVGRPNVGKSTLVNALVGEERVLTGPEAGMTRDAIAVEWTWRDRPIRLVDTAGPGRDQAREIGGGRHAARDPDGPCGSAGSGCQCHSGQAGSHHRPDGDRRRARPDHRHQ